MAKRATIKDIATRAGVSIGSVHYALNGKEGVGEETRTRILAVARELSYRVNTSAAALKRKTIRIAASFPEPTGNYKYYFPFIWDGVRDCIDSFEDYHDIETVEMPYRDERHARTRALTQLLKRNDLNGIITRGHTDDEVSALIQEIYRRGIPIVLVGDETPDFGEICCVQTNYEIVGRTMAELLTRQMPPEGVVLFCAGHIAIPSHGRIIQGFERYLEDIGSKHRVRSLNTDDLGAKARDAIRRELASDDVVACASVSSNCTVLLGKALKASGKAGLMPAVGSDLFKESAAFLREGVFTNLVHKHPYSQAHTAARILLDHLVRGAALPRESVYVASEVVFKSTLPLYDAPKGRFSSRFEGAQVPP